VMRHTTAMQLLQAGLDIATIALCVSGILKLCSNRQGQLVV